MFEIMNIKRRDRILHQIILRFITSVSPGILYYLMLWWRKDLITLAKFVTKYKLLLAC